MLSMMWNNSFKPELEPGQLSAETVPLHIPLHNHLPIGYLSPIAIIETFTILDRMGVAITEALILISDIWSDYIHWAV